MPLLFNKGNWIFQIQCKLQWKSGLQGHFCKVSTWTVNIIIYGLYRLCTCISSALEFFFSSSNQTCECIWLSFITLKEPVCCRRDRKLWHSSLKRAVSIYAAMPTLPLRPRERPSLISGSIMDSGCYLYTFHSFSLLHFLCDCHSDSFHNNYSYWPWWELCYRNNQGLHATHAQLIEWWRDHSYCGVVMRCRKKAKIIMKSWNS